MAIAVPTATSWYCTGAVQCDGAIAIFKVFQVGLSPAAQFDRPGVQVCSRVFKCSACMQFAAECDLLPWKKKTATTIMHKIRTLFLSWDIEKSSLIALRCAAMRKVAASRATVPIS